MSALQKLTDTDLSELKFGFSQYVTIGGVECHVARGGYTGEDGFEVRRHSDALKTLLADVHRLCRLPFLPHPPSKSLKKSPRTQTSN